MTGVLYPVHRPPLQDRYPDHSNHYLQNNWRCLPGSCSHLYARSIVLTQAFPDHNLGFLLQHHSYLFRYQWNQIELQCMKDIYQTVPNEDISWNLNYYHYSHDLYDSLQENIHSH